MISYRHYLALTAVLFLFSINATAQTYVRGYVSGTWTPAGSPYIADSTIVIHQDSLLVIQPGVDVQFPVPRDTLKVQGELRAWGTENDSITFYGQDWGGIRFYPTAAQTTRMEYCSINSILEADSISIALNHCSLNTNSVRIIYSPMAVLQNCETTAHFSIDYSTCLVENNRISYLDLHGSTVNVQNNEILEGCYIQGSGVFTYNTLPDAGLGIAYNVRVSHNFIGGRLRLASCSDTIEYNEIHGDIYTGGTPYIRNNLIINDGYCINGGPVVAVNNTMVCVDQSGGGAICRFLFDGSTVKNNILVGSGNDCVGIRHQNSSPHANIRYNTYWHVGTLYYNCSPTAGDTIADPRLVDIEEGDYTLRPDSPCIDSGDPADPLDPDGSRRDRGYAFFDHRIDHPPVIFSPTSAIAQRGFEFSYAALAVDDRGTLNLSFLDLPYWLNVNPPEFVYDSLTVSGEVPPGTNDFSFTVIAEDGSAQTDTEHVNVETTDYTVLTGVVTDFLPVRRSPYLMVDSLFVPAGSSLTIEPGCVLKAKYHEQEVHRASLNVYGQLTAVGTEEDSIYFISERSLRDTCDWHGLKFYNCNSETSRVSYSVISHAFYSIVADNSSSLNIDHNSFSLGWNSVWLTDSSNISVNNNKFQHFQGSMVHSYRSRVEIRNNYFYNPYRYCSTIHTEYSIAEIRNNILKNANSI